MRTTYARAATAIVGLALITPELPDTTVPSAADEAAAALAGSGGVVVNEFAPSDAARQAEEFVELRNTGDRLVALGGWELQSCLSPTTVKTAALFPIGAEIPPGGYYLLAHASYTGARLPDAHYDVEVSADGGWLLHDPWTGYTDGVGLDADLACTEGDAAPQCDWAAGEAVTRDEQGKDTDDNTADFACQPRTPGR